MSKAKRSRTSIKRSTRPRAARKSTPIDPYRHLSFIPLPQSVAGIHLTPDEALQLSVVWACIDAIVKAVTCSEWRIYEWGVGRNKTFLPDDPIYWVLNVRPNPEMTAIAVREALYYAAVSSGNGYAEIARSLNGRVVELWPLPADRVQPMRIYDESGKPGAIVYEYRQWSGDAAYIPASDMLHVRGPSLDGLLGDNMIARAAKSIGTAVAQERFGASYFANNTIMGTVLEYPGVVNDATYNRLRSDWEEHRRGPQRAHKPIILEGGMKLVPFGHEAGKAQLVEQRQFSVEDICRFFGVPPHKVQHLLRATYNNIEHLGIEFTRDAVTPWARRGEQEVDFKLFAQRAPWKVSRHDTSWLMFGDAKSRAEAQQIWRRSGIYSANDILEMEGRNTIGREGDVRIVESNMQTYKTLIAAEKKATVEAERAAESPPPPAPPSGQPPPTEGDGADESDEVEVEAPSPQPQRDGRLLAERAVISLASASLERYARRLANRESDLRRSGKMSEVQVQARMAELRAEWRVELREDLEEALSIASQLAPEDPRVVDNRVTKMADLVDNGEEPRAAAAVSLGMRGSR